MRSEVPPCRPITTTNTLTKSRPSAPSVTIDDRPARTPSHHGGDQHSGHDAPGGHEDQGGHDKHEGHSPGMFRDRFWWSLVLTLPVVFFSEMVQEWFGYTAPTFPGSDWISPVLGTAIFVYGGAPFLKGAVSEIRDRQPGMMLLIGMAITVAFVASAATTFGWFDLEFWWELAALITIMLLGHWMEMRAIGQARGALAALAELLPDEAERIVDGETQTVSISELAVGRRRAGPPRGTCPGRWRHRRRVGRDRRVDGHGRVPSRPQNRRRQGGRRHGRYRLGDPHPRRSGGRRHGAGRYPASGRAGATGRGPGRRCWPTGLPPCCSTSPLPPRW